MASKQQKSVVTETEHLFESVLRYCEARREFWDALGKAEQRSFFPPIFVAVRTLSELLPEQEPNGFGLMDVAQGRELVNRGLEIVRSQVEWLEMQYPAGIECIVCGILPPSFSNGVDVACPDFRCFLSPLRMALSMMGSKLGDTPKESWWQEDCEPEIENPIPGVLHAIHKKLKKAEPDFVESDYAEPMLKSDLANLFDVSLSTIVRRIKTGALRVMPGTIATAKQVRIHGDDFPSGLKRPQERKQKLSPASKHGSRQ